MKNVHHVFIVSIVVLGMIVIQAFADGSLVFGADYSGVYQCEVRGDAQLEGFMKMKQTDLEILAEFSWDPHALPGTVTGQTLRFETSGMKLTLMFTTDGTVFEGEWERKNEAGTITGTKVEPSRWPISDFSTLPALPDSDMDGLPDDMEQKYGTDASQADSDGDSLTDYDEVRKYRTNPLSPDSDGDGKEDSVWEERREYTYSIQAIVDLRPPFDVQHMNDFYQDARLIKELGDDISRVEVILYPEAQVILNPSPYRRVRNAYTEPTYTKNYSSAMAEQLEHVVKGVQTDIQAIASILDEFKTISFVDIQEDLGYQTDQPLYFHVYVDSRGNVLEEGMSETTTHSLDEIKAHTLFAESMYQFRTHGACGSKAILRGALLRAVGIPEKTIVTIPLLYTYETDKTNIILKEQYYDHELLNIASQKVRAVDHFFNEALIGSQWVRVDHKIDTGVRAPNRVSIKILEAHDTTSYHFFPYWNYETWREKRVYQYVSVIEQEAIYE
jgi:hypothetical protein